MLLFMSVDLRMSVEVNWIQCSQASIFDSPMRGQRKKDRTQSVEEERPRHMAILASPSFQI